MSDKPTPPDTSAASTDVPEFVSDLDGGQFERMLSIALSKTAAACIDYERGGEVVIKFKMERIPGTQQLRLGHKLAFGRPTMTGKVTEETEGATVLYVGRYGALSLAQPSLLEHRQQQLPGTN